MRQTTGKLRKPTNRDGKMAALAAYIKKEQSRPSEQQFTLPPLADAIALYDTIKAAKSARKTGRTGRMQNRVELIKASEQLLNYIQLALHDIVARYYNFSLAPGLREWGFEVTRRQRSSSAKDDTATSSDTDSSSDTPANTNGDSSTSTNDSATVSTNGTAAVEVVNG